MTRSICKPLSIAGLICAGLASGSALAQGASVANPAAQAPHFDALGKPPSTFTH